MRDDRAQATRIAAAVGLGVVWLLILGGFALMILTGDVVSGVWLALIGWFLTQAAGNRYQRAAGGSGA